MNRTKKAALLGLIGMMLAPSFALAKHAAADQEIARGRYLIVTGSCNDCHTPRYAEQGGRIPEVEWLTGDTIGWQGPWGTNYAANLRLRFQQMSESEWLARPSDHAPAHAQPRLAGHDPRRPDGDLPLCSTPGAQGQSGSRLCAA